MCKRESVHQVYYDAAKEFDKRRRAGQGPIITVDGVTGGERQITVRITYNDGKERIVRTESIIFGSETST